MCTWAAHNPTDRLYRPPSCQARTKLAGCVLPLAKALHFVAGKLWVLPAVESSSSAVLGGAAAPRASGQARTLGPVASARPPEVGPRNLASALLRRDAPPRQRPGPLLSLCCSRRLQRSQADGVAPWRSLLRLTRAQRKGGRNGRGVVRHAQPCRAHPPTRHSFTGAVGPPARASLGRARSVRGGGRGLPCGVARVGTERSTARDDACRQRPQPMALRSCGTLLRLPGSRQRPPS